MFTPQEQTILRILILSVSIGLIIANLRLNFVTEVEYSATLNNIKQAVDSANSIKIDEINSARENTVRNVDKFININTARKVDLQTIPGVGPVTADRILAYRQKIGRIKDLEDLGNVKGIGPKTLKRIKPYVIF